MPIPLYPLPGQARGVYARSDDLARYLAGLNPSPPDRSATTVPLDPTGNPPGPGSRSSETKVSRGKTST